MNTTAAVPVIISCEVLPSGASPPWTVWHDVVLCACPIVLRQLRLRVFECSWQPKQVDQFFLIFDVALSSIAVGALFAGWLQCHKASTAGLAAAIQTCVVLAVMEYFFCLCGVVFTLRSAIVQQFLWWPP